HTIRSWPVPSSVCGTVDAGSGGACPGITVISSCSGHRRRAHWARPWSTAVGPKMCDEPEAGDAWHEAVRGRLGVREAAEPGDANRGRAIRLRNFKDAGRGIIRANERISGVRIQPDGSDGIGAIDPFPQHKLELVLDTGVDKVPDEPPFDPVIGFGRIVGRA